MGDETEYPALEYIDTPDALHALCTDLAGCDWLALDTEFIREKTYYPQLCLIQIGVPGRAACIDPLALDSLEPLYALLFDTGIVKVLHACSQDLEIFVHLTGRVPWPIFDTQLAAPLLGLAEQIGYGNFVRELLGVQLDKAHARTDWARRPLSVEQLEYAADDVRYLGRIYPMVVDKLQRQGRLAWLDAEFGIYGDSERYRTVPENAWQRIKGLEKLRPKALAIVQQLAAWRETQAQAKNLPRNWILKDEHLLDIARMAPSSPAGLSKIRGMPPKTVERYGQALLKRVEQGQGAKPEPLKGFERKAKPTVQEEALADVLHAQLRLLAERNAINSAVIAGRKDLLALIRGEPTRVLEGWRRELAGDELLAMRDGQRIVSVSDGRVLVRAADADL